MAATQAPSSMTKDREIVVDRLRGFALFGVLLVNAPFLLTSVNGMTDSSMPTFLDRLAGFLTWTLFQAKSYVIFSFLFGYSLALLLDKIADRGQSPRRIYCQRLVSLALIGLFHAFLFFVGDILVIYALLGTILLALRRRSNRTLLSFAAIFFLVQLLFYVALALIPSGDTTIPASIDESWATGGLIDATLTRIRVWPVALLFVMVLQGMMVASLFCVGLVCGRHRILANPEAIRPLLVRLRKWGFVVGLPLQAVAGLGGVWPGIDQSQGRQLLSIAVMYVTAPILSVAYVATIALLPRRGLVRALESDGKMSLSVYLGESILATTLAAGWGFGLFGLSTGSAFLVAIAIWLGLLLAASSWLRWFGSGPAERLLRRMTFAGVTTPNPKQPKTIPS